MSGTDAVPVAEVFLMTAGRCRKNLRSYSIVAMLNEVDALLAGCLLVTHLPVKVELRRRPELRGRPLVVSRGASNRPVVQDASPEAAGVLVGQTVSEALSRCPGAVVVPADLQDLDRVNGDLLAALCDVVPGVEPAAPGVFYLDCAGMAGVYGGWAGLAEAVLAAIEVWLRPRLGIGPGKFPAYCASACADAGGWLRVPCAASAWLAPLPASWLPLEPDAVARLAGFGIRTLGDVAALSQASLTDFLGPAGGRAWRLANGVDLEPVLPAVLPERVTAAVEFPFLVDTVSGIESGLRALAGQVWSAVRGRTVGVAALEGRLLSGGTWLFRRDLPRPAVSAEALVRALRSALGARDALGMGRWPDSALLDLSLTVSGLVAEAGGQAALWSRPPRREVPVVAGVDRLARLVPGSALPERRWAFASSLAPLSSPAPVRVMCVADVPRCVGSGNAGWRDVEDVVDRWEVDTEWWTPDPVCRHYWRLALVDGGLTTVYLDLVTGSWFRQGY